MASEAPVIRLVNAVITDAIEKRASDIHIEPFEKEFRIRFRIDGVLSNQETPPRELKAAIISRLKLMAKLNIAERRLPQDGRIKIKILGREVDLRVSTMPTLYGESVVMRLLDRSAGDFYDLRRLGFDDHMLSRMEHVTSLPHGIFLVTGPTGSGKSTTLYSALKRINLPDKKIITIEDPVEYQVRGITQVPVNEKKGLTFARGLRSILRHDPDKIMVGEIRDQETAQIAINSALTGHLVFTTVHANNVTDVIGRFINMGVEPYNFVSALNCIMAQRLVRLVCENCKRRVTYSPEVLRESGLEPSEWGEAAFAEGAGCLECSGSGYRGRTAISEMLDLSDRIREMIIDRRPTSEIKRAAREGGMMFLRESGLRKVRSGVTTLREINKVTFLD
jgi:type II secretory ATPase GspE/PulE/Tfp pilus assembly ATPase PilB-like protein